MSSTIQLNDIEQLQTNENSILHNITTDNTKTNTLRKYIEISSNKAISNISNKNISKYISQLKQTLQQQYEQNTIFTYIEMKKHNTFIEAQYYILHSNNTIQKTLQNTYDTIQTIETNYTPSLKRNETAVKQYKDTTNDNTIYIDLHTTNFKQSTYALTQITYTFPEKY